MLMQLYPLQDVTCVDARLTQGLIDQVLAVPQLGLGSFRSASSIAALLEASDKEFKDQLGAAVDLALWEAAREEAGRAARSHRQEADAVGSRSAYLEGELGTLRARLGSLRAEEEAWDAAALDRRSTAEDRVRMLCVPA